MAGFARLRFLLRLHWTDRLALHRVDIHSSRGSILGTHQQRVIVGECGMHPIAATHVVSIFERHSVSQIRRDRRAPASVVLQSAANRKRIAIIRRDIVKLADRKIDAEQPGCAAVERNRYAAVAADNHVIRAFRIDPQNVILAVNLAEYFAEIAGAVIGYKYAAIRSHDVYAIQVLGIDIDPAVIDGPRIESRHMLPCFARIEAAKNSAARGDRIRRLRSSPAATASPRWSRGFGAAFASTRSRRLRAALAPACGRRIRFHDGVDRPLIARENCKANTPLTPRRQTIFQFRPTRA